MPYGGGMEVLEDAMVVQGDTEVHGMAGVGALQPLLPAPEGYKSRPVTPILVLYTAFAQLAK